MRDFLVIVGDYFIFIFPSNFHFPLLEAKVYKKVKSITKDFITFVLFDMKKKEEEEIGLFY